VCTASHVRATAVVVVRQDTSYLETPIGRAAAAYLAIKRKRLSEASERGYEQCLADLALHYPELAVADFEPPRGAELLEQFLAKRWGRSAPRTYNKNLSILSDFFKKQVLNEELRRDPTMSIERAKKSAVYRTVFTTEQRDAIIAAAANERERIALKLLLHYGIRKGTLQRVRFAHFKRDAGVVWLFTKGDKVQKLPVPDESIWQDLDALGDVDPEHYLIPRQKLTKRPTQIRKAHEIRSRIAALQDELAAVEAECEWVRLYPAERIGDHALHDWWYRILAKAGIVEEGVTQGARMHRARHSAGQHILNVTGNLKAVQKTLGHASVNTTGDVYTDWDDLRLAETLREVLVA